MPAARRGGFFLLLALLFPAFGWVLASDPPRPNRRFGAVMKDPALWERSNRLVGRLILALAPPLALAACRLPFLANPVLFSPGWITAVSWALTRSG